MGETYEGDGFNWDGIKQHFLTVCVALFLFLNWFNAYGFAGIRGPLSNWMHHLQSQFPSWAEHFFTTFDPVVSAGVFIVFCVLYYNNVFKKLVELTHIQDSAQDKRSGRLTARLNKRLGFHLVKSDWYNKAGIAKLTAKLVNAGDDQASEGSWNH